MKWTGPEIPILGYQAISRFVRLGEYLRAINGFFLAYFLWKLALNKN
jgi:hypothetical protein